MSAEGFKWNELLINEWVVLAHKKLSKSEWEGYDKELVKFKEAQFICNRPPLGITPLYIHREARLAEIYQAVMRFKGIGKDIPEEWISEMKELENEIYESGRKFKVEDGEAYEGERGFAIHPQSTFGWELIPNWRLCLNISSDVKQFKTKEAANDYLISNMPLPLSLNELVEKLYLMVWGQNIPSEINEFKKFLYRKIKKAVETKLYNQTNR